MKPTTKPKPALFTTTLLPGYKGSSLSAAKSGKITFQVSALTRPWAKKSAEGFIRSLSGDALSGKKISVVIPSSRTLKRKVSGAKLLSVKPLRAPAKVNF